MSDAPQSTIGVVVIGRNEGERLRRCLESIGGNGLTVVYVDSGSTDGSSITARSLGADVIDLNMTTAFTAARARNAGWQQLVRMQQNAEFIQFVDGDCEVAKGWLDAAFETLLGDPNIAAVCGRRRERDREATVYNRLCDLEWDTPIGPTGACGGDAMFRRTALEAVGGFCNDMIAGEEPELCFRLRQTDGEILRIDREMTKHDAAITTFRQWWKRAVRAGHAYAEGAAMTRGKSPGLWHREVRSIWFWGIILPFLAIALAWWTKGLSLVLLIGYPILWLRVFARAVGRWGGRDACAYATFCVVAKFAHVAGAFRYYRNRLFGGRGPLIEYKNRNVGPSRDFHAITIAYLVNQYPHISHTFIRREIAALEKSGSHIARFSIRPAPSELVDAADRVEAAKTHVILTSGVLALLSAVARKAILHPVLSVRALTAAVRMGRRSDRGLFRHLIYLTEACYLAKQLQTTGAKHVHAHFGTNSATVAMLANLVGGPPFSFTVHGPEEFDKPESLSLRDKIRAAKFVVAISSYGRSQLCRWSPPDEWYKIKIVRCGLDAEFLTATPTPVQDVQRLVCVGRLCEQKGQLVLLDALQKVRESIPQIDVILAGDGPMRGLIDARIMELNLKSNVRITGWVNNQQVRELIQSSRATVLPSFAEGLPVVLMESLALGRPVITTFVAGIPELVRPGSNGWLVPAGSVDDLAKAISEALTAPIDLLNRFGTNGAAAVGRCHDVNSEAAHLAELFRQP
jgi:glycosyltransferase involved in cell wall biosynthesis/GT2 family glycosyltransferase